MMLRGIFPNLNYTIASYSPVTTFISFESFKEKDWKSSLGLATNWKHSEMKGMIHHEARHYVDHMSTLWGQKNLVSLYKALNARLSLDETRFSDIVKYKKQERELHFADYYHELYNAYVWKSGAQNWEYQFSTGFRFKDDGSFDERKPIMFVRFRTVDGKSLSRVPVSIASLLETNATFQEVEVRDKYVNSQTPKKDLEKFNDWLMGSLIYNNDRSIYNVAAHLAANLLDISDPRIAFRICSSVASLTLNLPHKLVETLPIKNDEMQAWTNRPKDVLVNHEYGFIFFNLLNNYKEFYKKGKEYKLEDLLSENKLPEEARIFEAVKLEMKEFANEFYEENLKEYFLGLHQKGLELFNVRGVDGSNYSISKVLSSEVNKPNVIFSDSKIKSRFQEFSDVIKVMPLKEVNNDDFYQIASMTDERMNALFEIRGI